jgi:hypothetical protein
MPTRMPQAQPDDRTTSAWHLGICLVPPARLLKRHSAASGAAQGETDMPLVIDAIGLGAALAAVVDSGISRTYR